MPSKKFNNQPIDATNNNALVYLIMPDNLMFFASMISDNVQVRLVGGKIVRSQQQQHEASVTSTSSPKYDYHDFPPSGDD